MSDFDLAFDALPAKNDSSGGDNPFTAGDPFAPAANQPAAAKPQQPASSSQDLFSVQPVSKI